MNRDRPRLLYVTDFGYQARGRRYGDEDLLLSARLRDDFVLATCHPRDATGLMDDFDLVVVRNTGPVLFYRDAYDAFRAHALATGARVYNELSGRGDMAGKGYLVEMTAAGLPVIPTVADPGELNLLPDAEQYVVKPVLGADSVGLELLDPSALTGARLEGMLVQPRVDFRYEVSFYFVDDAFQYALHAPDPSRRWELAPYQPSEADLRFAEGFVAWNSISHGIQRVDACRTADGELLLVELEDLNPYLSLDLVGPAARESFVRALSEALLRACAGAAPPGPSSGSPAPR
jgi:hypothetical protein